MKEDYILEICILKKDYIHIDKVSHANVVCP